MKGFGITPRLRPLSPGTLAPTTRKVGLILAVPLLLGLPGCGRAPHPAPAAALPTAEVQAAVVEEKARTASEEAVGLVRSKLRVLVEAKVNARIEQLLVVPGTMVKEGQLLVQLDEREIRARLDQAAATLEQADRDLRRMESLLREQAVTQAEFDAVQARQRVAKAGVSEAETALSYTRILASGAGVISRKMADVGDLAGPGKPLLELEDPTALRLEAAVPEALVGHLQLGAKCPVQISALATNLEGVVGEIAPAADPYSHTFEVKLDLPRIEGLRVGQFGRVAVPLQESRALRVPSAAVVQRGQMELVFVVSGDRAQLRLVKTGKRLGAEVEVVSGLEAGERIVVSGAARLTDGQPVKIVP